MINIYKKNKFAYLIMFISLISILTACGKQEIAGDYSGKKDSTLILNEDKTGYLDGGRREEDITWDIKDGYIIIKRDNIGDLKAKLPSDNKVEHLTVEPVDAFSDWNTEIFDKVQ